MSNRIKKAKPAKRAGLDPARRARIDQALAQGDIQGAAGVAEAALAAGLVDPLVLNLAAWRREEAGDYAGAHDLLRQALALSPGDVLVRGDRRGAAQGAPLDEALACSTVVTASRAIARPG